METQHEQERDDSVEIARAIPARATVCFIWSAGFADFIAVGCAEEGYRGPADAREVMTVTGDVVGKRFIELRRERAEQLRRVSR